MKRPRLGGCLLEGQSRWLVLIEEFDATLCVYLPLVNALSLDSVFISYFLERPAL